MIDVSERRAELLTAAIALAIGWASLTPLPAQPVPGGDKLHHLIAYAALCFPLLFKNARSAVVVLPLAIAYGGAIELIQPYVNRYGEWLDFAANAAGCLIGFASALMLRKFLRRRNGAA